MDKGWCIVRTEVYVLGANDGTASLWFSREAAEKLKRGEFVNTFGGLQVPESAQVNQSPVDTNTGLPRFEPFMPRYAFNSTCVVASNSPVGSVLRNGSCPQIDATIIKTVAVYMIGEFSLRHAQDYTVHPEASLFSVSKPLMPDSIKCVPIPCRAPFVF